MNLYFVYISCMLFVIGNLYSGGRLFNDIEPDYDQFSNPTYNDSRNSSDVQSDGVDDRELARRMVNITNEYRKGIDMEPLSGNTIILSVAKEQAGYMCRYKELKHSSPEGTLKEKLTRKGFQGVNIGQNIAKQENSDYRALAQAWVRSFEHRKNILGDFTYSEAATCRDSEGNRYWVQIFGKNITNREVADALDIKKLRKLMDGGNMGLESSKYVIMLKPNKGLNKDSSVEPHGNIGLFGGLRPLKHRQQGLLQQFLDKILEDTEVLKDPTQDKPNKTHLSDYGKNSSTFSAEGSTTKKSHHDKAVITTTIFVDRSSSSTGSTIKNSTTSKDMLSRDSLTALFHSSTIDTRKDYRTSEMPITPIIIYKTTTDYVLKTITENTKTFPLPQSILSSHGSLNVTITSSSESTRNKKGNHTSTIDSNSRLEKKIDKIAAMVKNMMNKSENSIENMVGSSSIPSIIISSNSLSKSIGSSHVFASVSTTTPIEIPNSVIISFINELKNSFNSTSTSTACKCKDMEKDNCCSLSLSGGTISKYKTTSLHSNDPSPITSSILSKRSSFTASPVVSLNSKLVGLPSFSIGENSVSSVSTQPSSISPSVSTLSHKRSTSDVEYAPGKSTVGTTAKETIPKAAIVSAIKDLLKDNEFNVRVLDRKEIHGQIEIPKALLIME
ncbi:hypothetical protein PAEPH01_0634 [Pancytospora epiphaga]|nr:hypothetical protein PAEPH01_0634 [Pancytospora epiphaga]